MTKFVTCSCASEWKDEAYLILRVVTGLAFFYHGYAKVFDQGLDQVTGFFVTKGIPMANILAPLVSYGELLGGLALMLGFLAHWVSKAFIVIMIGAIGFVHWGAAGGWFNGYGAPGGYEYALLLLAASIFFMVFGSGKYSVDAKFGSMYGITSN
jgi:putative oxidoreductase